MIRLVLSVSNLLISVVSNMAKSKWYQWLFNPARSFLRLFDSKVNGGAGTSTFAKITGQELTGAEREANAFTANEAQKQRDWQQQMSDTSYQRAVADMQSAGLNPALLYGSGANGAVTPSGSAASSVSPSSGSSLSDILQLLSFKKDLEVKDADKSEKEAGAFKAIEEGKDIIENAKDRREGVNIRRADMEIRKGSLELQKQAREDAHKLNEAEIQKIASDVQKNAAEIRNLAYDNGLKLSQTEVNKQAAVLHGAQAMEIVELLEYRKLVMSKQAEFTDVDIDRLRIQNAFNSSLYTDDYIDACISKACSDAGISLSNSQVAGVRAQLRTGSWDDSLGPFDTRGAEVLSAIVNLLDLPLGIVGGLFK